MALLWDTTPVASVKTKTFRFLSECTSVYPIPDISTTSRAALGSSAPSSKFPSHRRMPLPFQPQLAHHLWHGSSDVQLISRQRLQ